MSTYECPIGGRTTAHPRDVQERYCPHCDVFPDMLLEAANVGLDCSGLLTAGAPCTVEDIQRALAEKGSAA